MSARPEQLKGIALAVTGMIVISPDALLIRSVAADDLQIVFWRGVFLWIILTGYLWFRRPGGLGVALRAGGRAGRLSACLIAASTVAFIASITRTEAANTLAILSVLPLFAALLGWLVLREPIRLRTWFAMAAALGGMAVIFAGSVRAGSWLGDALAVVAGLSMAGNLVLLRRHPELSPLPALCLSGLIVALAVGGFAEPFAVAARDLVLLLVMALLVHVVALALFFRAAALLPPAEVALFALIETVLGPFWVWLALGETPAPATFAGGGLVIGALAGHSIAALRAARA